ncbi:hypothetical protein FEM48_Zijuj09G0147500 [Ziziphus jujuba var. spinosa]|uniref:UDP-glycosyltransferase 74F2-like n=1 Tax=Ziziphus jujuba var. spinosa TaxID=714518 RepID=A0A978UTL1_ZIZJJ|nr:hypothetical protein FEM48_Zijuj09G0147500 [Ziziphus jujuba var. spinosa]
MSIKSDLSTSQHTEMEKAKITHHQSHCLALAYPTQGHINPMLQFSKRLEQKGVKVTLVTTKSICKTIHSGCLTSIPITFETISDGYDEGGLEDVESIQAYLESFRLVGSQTLMELLKKISRSGFPVDCIVYDAFLPWALDVGKKFGLKGAVFFTQSCAVGTILYHIHKGLLKVPLLESEILLPGLPSLEPSDMPSYVYDLESYPAVFKLLVDQFSNINEADWILCNTYYELEKEAVSKPSSMSLFGYSLKQLTMANMVKDVKADLYAVDPHNPHQPYRPAVPPLTRKGIIIIIIIIIIMVKDGKVQIRSSNGGHTHMDLASYIQNPVTFSIKINYEPHNLADTDRNSTNWAFHNTYMLPRSQRASSPSTDEMVVSALSTPGSIAKR